MAVITKYKNLKSKTVIQYNNELKTLESVNVDDSYVKSQVIVKAPVTSDELSSEKVTVYKDVVVQPDNNDTMIRFDKFKDQLVKPIIDASTIIDNPKWLIKDPIQDSSLNWRPATPDTDDVDVYTNFPVNGRAATWLDLINSIEIVKRRHSTALDEILNNNVYYDVFLGTEQIINIDGVEKIVFVCNGCVDCDTHENITFNKILKVCETNYKPNCDRLDTHFRYYFSIKYNNRTYPVGYQQFWLNRLDYYANNPNIEIPLCEFVYYEQDLYTNTGNSIILGMNIIPGLNLNYDVIENDNTANIDISKIPEYSNDIISFKNFKKFPTISWVCTFHEFDYKINTRGVNLYLRWPSHSYPNLSIWRDPYETGLINRFRIIPNNILPLGLKLNVDNGKLEYKNDVNVTSLGSQIDNDNANISIYQYGVGYALTVMIGDTTDGLPPTVDMTSFKNIWIQSNIWMSESEANRDPRIIMKYGNNGNWFFWPKSIAWEGQNISGTPSVYDITGERQPCNITLSLPIDPLVLMKSNLTFQIKIIKFLYNKQETLDTYETIKTIVIPFSKLYSNPLSLLGYLYSYRYQGTNIVLIQQKKYVTDYTYKLTAGESQAFKSLWRKNLADIICPHLKPDLTDNGKIIVNKLKVSPLQTTLVHYYMFNEIINFYNENIPVYFSISAFKYTTPTIK